MIKLVCVLVVACLLASTIARQITTKQRQRALQLRTEKFFEDQESKLHAKLKHRLDKISLSLQAPNKYRVKTDPGDIEALEAFYKSTDGDKWNNNTGWMKGDPCADPLWFGVYCRNGRVLQLNLVNNQLSGPLPPALAKATEMQVLRFYTNFLTGPIPTEIFGMKALQVFDVNTNQVTGEMPSRISLSNLTDLVLYNNKLTGNLPDMYTPMLKTYEVSSNGFTGPLPEGLSQSKGLEQLVVSRNMLTGDFPSSYGVFSELQRLWTFYNNFDRPTLPDSWSGMRSMQEIQADGLYGDMPDWFDNWRDLQVFVLINGQLTGNFPPSLCDSLKMQNLRVFNNSLTGQIPRCICTFKTLSDIEISDNQFTGPMPDCIGDVATLTAIYFSRNNFTGEFPPSIGQLVNLATLDVSQNLMTGRIPSTVNNLNAEIAEFAICYNKFSSIDSGLEDFFDRIKNFGCAFYNNPWSCPVSSEVPKECDAVCSQCNTGSQHSDCSACIGASGCGWCSQGPNCLEGETTGPDVGYRCVSSQWTYGSTASCP